VGAAGEAPAAWGVTESQGAVASRSPRVTRLVTMPRRLVVVLALACSFLAACGRPTVPGPADRPDSAVPVRAEGWTGTCGGAAGCRYEVTIIREGERLASHTFEQREGRLRPVDVGLVPAGLPVTVEFVAWHPRQASGTDDPAGAERGPSCRSRVPVEAGIRGVGVSATFTEDSCSIVLSMAVS
jgi:hypothetical protein